MGYTNMGDTGEGESATITELESGFVQFHKGRGENHGR